MKDRRNTICHRDCSILLKWDAFVYAKQQAARQCGSIDNPTDPWRHQHRSLPAAFGRELWADMHLWNGSAHHKRMIPPTMAFTPSDATIALHLAATGGWDAAADVDGDSRITSLDALMILKAAADVIDL